MRRRSGRQRGDEGISEYPVLNQRIGNRDLFPPARKRSWMKEKARECGKHPQHPQNTTEVFFPVERSAGLNMTFYVSRHKTSSPGR